MASESRPAPISDVAAKQVLLERFAGDAGFLGEVIQLFLNHTPNTMTQLRAAVTRQEAEAIRHWAHTLKGAVANFESGRACAAAAKMESLGRAGDIAGAASALPEVEMEMSALLPALEKIRTELT